MVRSEKLTTGGEVLAKCGKCHEETLHRIIAMVGDEPAKVECVSCHAVHKYRMADEDKLALKKAKRDSGKVPSKDGRAAKARKPRKLGVRAAAALAEENARIQDWESHVNGKALSDFKVYTPKETFEEGDILRHKKFGDGFVVRIIDATKMEVMFEHGPRTLIQSLGA